MPTRRRRLDTRSLRPRDYLADPWLFGRSDKVPLVLPAGGDVVSMRVAGVQHRIAVRIRHDVPRSASRAVTAAFGFSKQYWSTCLLGESWMGETVFAAATTLLLDYPRD